MEPHSVFNDLDYIVIGVVLLSGLLALMRGFVRELFSLIAWVGAYLAATKFYHPAIPWAHHYVKNDKAAEWAAMALVFVIALIILVIIGNLVCGLVKGRALTSIDRSLGFVYGLARGGLVVCLLYLSAVMILWPDIDMPPSDQQANKDRNTPPELLVQAKTRPMLSHGAKILKELIPKEMLDKTIKDAEAQKRDAEKSAHDKLLENLSFPTPIDTSNGTNAAKPSTQGK